MRTVRAPHPDCKAPHDHDLRLRMLGKLEQAMDLLGRCTCTFCVGDVRHVLVEAMDIVARGDR